MRPRVVAAPIGLAAAFLPILGRAAAAHGFGVRYDLPVPLWLYLAGAGSAVALSFVAIALFAGAPRRPEVAARPRARLPSLPARCAAGEAVAVGLLLAVMLAGNCRLRVAGYTLRREWYDGEFSSGIENIASDSLSGLDSLVFIRTVKLKDFPWNGWLRLGVPSPPAAGWNPVAGFSDPAGRLIWAALGDAAAFPAPYGAGWTLDRIADVTPIR